jgi:hypothetical protein
MRPLSIVLTLGVIFPALAGEQVLHVKVWPTPEQQLFASRELIGQIGRIPPDKPEDQRRALGMAVASLEAVARRWPDRGAAITEADVLEAQILTAPMFYDWATAEQVARRGLSRAGNRPQAALLYAILGTSLGGLQRPAEAEQAFSQAIAHPGFSALNWVEQAEVYESASFFYEKQGNGKEAAKYLRAAAHIADSPLISRIGLIEMALERAAGPDPESAREDLAGLEALLVESRRQNYSNPGDLAKLRTCEEALAKYKKQLGR